MERNDCPHPQCNAFEVTGAPVPKARQSLGLGATKGVFATTSTFSSHAAEFVRHLTQRVGLIDGRELSVLIIEHGVGVRVRRALEFKRLDEDFFAEEG